MRVGTPPVNRWIQAQRAPLAPADAVPVARGREPYGVGPGRAARHPLASSTISRASMATVPAFATPDLPPIHSLFRFRRPAPSRTRPKQLAGLGDPTQRLRRGGDHLPDNSNPAVTSPRPPATTLRGRFTTTAIGGQPSLMPHHDCHSPASQRHRTPSRRKQLLDVLEQLLSTDRIIRMDHAMARSCGACHPPGVGRLVGSTECAALLART